MNPAALARRRSSSCPPARQGNQDDVRARRLPEDLVGGVVAVELGQADVEQHDLRDKTGRHAHRFLAVERRLDLVPAAAQQSAQGRGRVPVVVHHEDAAQTRRFRGGHRQGRVRAGGREGGRTGGGQVHDEFAAQAPARAVRLHPAAVQLHQAAHQTQADAQAALRPLQRTVFLREQVEDVRQHFGVDAGTVVLHAHEDAILVPAFRREDDLPAVRGVLGGVVEQVGENLRQPRRIGVHINGFRRELHRQRVPGLVDERAADFHGALHDLVQTDGLFAQGDPAPRDARDIEQVIDQTDHLRELAFHHFLRLAAGLRVVARGPEQGQGVAQRGEGVAQFVGQGGQELVLAAVGVAQFGVEVGVFHGDACAARQIGRHQEVERRVVPPGLRMDVGQRAQRFAAPGHRHAQKRARAEFAQDAQVFGVARHVFQDRAGHVGNHFRLARAQDGPDAVGIVQARRKPFAENLEQPFLRGIDVRDRQPP